MLCQVGLQFGCERIRSEEMLQHRRGSSTAANEPCWSYRGHFVGMTPSTHVVKWAVTIACIFLHLTKENHTF